METDNTNNNADDFRFSWAPASTGGSVGDGLYLTMGDTKIEKNWTPVINEWYHFAIIADGLDIKLYRNGTKIGSARQSAAGHDSFPLLVGAYVSGGLVEGTNLNTVLHGNLEDFRITKGVARYLSDFVVPYKSFSTYHGGAASCGSICYDTQHLYLEKAMYKNNEFDWYLTGYRESFIGFSGIDVHITGQDISGLLTLNYPDF